MRTETEDALSQELEEGIFVDESQQGRALSPEEAVDYALSPNPQPRRKSPSA